MQEIGLKMKKLEIVEHNCINFLDTLYALQEEECKELGIPVPPHGTPIELPDGRESIFHRLWEELMENQWGNQQFCNDSFYRVSFETMEYGTVYEDDLSDDLIKLLEYTRDALNPDGEGFAFLLFNVSW